MLGAILSLALGTYLVGSSLSKVGSSAEERKKAKEKGEEFYIDSNHKMRNVTSNEIVYTHINEKGRMVVEGVSTGFIYKDINSENLGKENKWLREHGYKYFWMPEYDKILGSIYVLFDPDEGKCFTCKRLQKFNSYSRIEERIQITYYDSEPYHLRSSKVIFKYGDDMKEWKYACGYPRLGQIGVSWFNTPKYH